MLNFNVVFVCENTFYIRKNASIINIQICFWYKIEYSLFLGGGGVISKNSQP